MTWRRLGGDALASGCDLLRSALIADGSPYLRPRGQEEHHCHCNDRSVGPESLPFRWFAGWGAERARCGPRAL
eukprot:scaffold20254_cov134-Isochrysis_galbana.AAC.1